MKLKNKLIFLIAGLALLSPLTLRQNTVHASSKYMTRTVRLRRFYPSRVYAQAFSRRTYKINKGSRIYERIHWHMGRDGYDIHVYGKNGWYYGPWWHGYGYYFNNGVHHHVNRVAQWYNDHTYRNRVNYARSNHISSHYYQPAFADADDDNSSLAVTNNYHSLIKGINSSDKYKVSRMISATTPLKAKYLKYISGNYNGNDSDVYAIKYHGRTYYYADELVNKGYGDPLQGYNASYYKGTINSWVKPYNSNAYLMHGQHLHKNVEWTYENPYTYHDDYYKYNNGHWHEEAISDDAPEYVQNS